MHMKRTVSINMTLMPTLGVIAVASRCPAVWALLGK